MTNDQLSQQVEAMLRDILNRVAGVGRQQYDMGTVQAIELKSQLDLLRDTLEELDDAVVYLTHLRARVLTLSQTIDSAENGETFVYAIVPNELDDDDYDEQYPIPALFRSEDAAQRYVDELNAEHGSEHWNVVPARVN